MKKMQTIHTCKKRGEQFILKSRTIPNLELSTRDALYYIANNEPIPANFIKKVVDANNDGIIDTEFRMLEALDELQIHEARKSYLLSKKADILKSATKPIAPSDDGSIKQETDGEEVEK
jgi:hypothetical protein